MLTKIEMEMGVAEGHDSETASHDATRWRSYHQLYLRRSLCYTSKASMSWKTTKGSPQPHAKHDCFHCFHCFHCFDCSLSYCLHPLRLRRHPSAITPVLHADSSPSERDAVRAPLLSQPDSCLGSAAANAGKVATAVGCRVQMHLLHQGGCLYCHVGIRMDTWNHRSGRYCNS